MEEKMMKSNGVDSRSSAMKRRRLFSAAAVLLAVCLVFVGAAGAAEYVAEIEGKGPFTSIQAAVEAAASGDVILVTESHNLSPDAVKQVSGSNVLILVDENKDITIDLNGKTVTVDYSGDVSQIPDIASVIWVANGAKLTLTDGSENKAGTLYVKTIETSKNKVQNLLSNLNSDDNKGGVEKCSMIIEGGSYGIDWGYFVGDSSGAVVYARNDKTTWVKGGNFRMGNHGTHTNNAPWIFNTKYGDANQIVVTGGTFNEDLSHRHWEYEVYIPEDYVLHNNGDKTWTVVDADTHMVAYVAEKYEKYGGTHERNVGYTTVEEAVSNAGKHHDSQTSENTITLVKNADVENTMILAKSTVFNINDGCTLTWNGNLGDPIFTVTDNDNGNSLKIDEFTPIRDKYEFGGWYTDAVFNNELTPNNGKLEVTGSLYAKWTELYRITFDTKGGSTVPPITEHDGTSITVPDNPTKTGYTFNGWNPSIPAEMPQYDQIITAQWTPITYSVAFDANDGDGEMTQQPFTYDVEAELPENGFTRTGYLFNGWNTERDGSGTSYEDKATVKNLTSVNGGTVTLYANWTAKSYTVTFNANGGSVTPESKTVTYGSSYGELPTPEWEGHTFKCWSQNSGGGMVFTEDVVVMSPNDHTLYAIWEENSAEGDVAPPTSGGGGGDGGHLSFPRFTENGGLVDFGSSKVVKALMLPEGSRGSVLLKVDTVEKWPKAVETEYPFDISVEKLGDGMAYIHFEIPVSALESLELTPADICAYHFDGEVWTKLPTTYEVKDGTVCYEAETDSFSPFKLVIEEGAATQKEEENVPVIPPTETPDVPDEPEILPPIDEPTKPVEPETPAPILAVLAGLGAAVIVRRK